MLWLGKKLFKLREKVSVRRKLSAEDDEKPFLDHLEDLRKTLMKIIVTLIVGMVACFTFTDQITKLIEVPILAAGVDIPDASRSPVGLKDPKEWPQVVSIAHGLLGLSAEQRAVFLEHAYRGENAHLQPVVDALLLYHASLDLPEAGRDAFLQAGAKGDEKVLSNARDMAAKKVDAGFERGPRKMRLWFSKPAEGFNMSMKLALYAGIAVSFPLLLYFLLEFIVPGLTKEERRVLWPALGVGFGLFLGGVTFAYLVVIPKALRFFVDYDQNNLGGVSDYRFSDYVSFVIQFTLIFGLCFELPVIVFALNKLGILSYALMRRTRSYAVIIIILVAAIITPTSDLINLSLLAVPMLVLYEISIWIAWLHDRGVAKREAAEEAAEKAAREARRERARMAGTYIDEPPPSDAGSDPHHTDPFHDPAPDPHSADFHDHGHEPDAHPDSIHGHDPHPHDPPAPESDGPAHEQYPHDDPPFAAEPSPGAESPADQVIALSDSAAPLESNPSPPLTPGEPSGEARRHLD